MSKFKGIFDAAKNRDGSNKQPDKDSKEIVKAEPIKNKVGRPRGKRSNPDYEQVTAYIKRQTYREIKIALLQQEELADFSELIEELLCDWLKTQKSE